MGLVTGSLIVNLARNSRQILSLVGVTRPTCIPRRSRILQKKHPVAHTSFETKYCKLHGFETVMFTVDRFFLLFCNASSGTQTANCVCNVDRACQTKKNMQSRIPLLNSSTVNYTVLKLSFSELTYFCCCFVTPPVGLRGPRVSVT